MRSTVRTSGSMFFVCVLLSWFRMKSIWIVYSRVPSTSRVTKARSRAVQSGCADSASRSTICESFFSSRIFIRLSTAIDRGVAAVFSLEISDIFFSGVFTGPRPCCGPLRPAYAPCCASRRPRDPCPPRVSLVSAVSAAFFPACMNLCSGPSVRVFLFR